VSAGPLSSTTKCQTASASPTRAQQIHGSSRLIGTDARSGSAQLARVRQAKRAVHSRGAPSKIPRVDPLMDPLTASSGPLALDEIEATDGRPVDVSQLPIEAVIAA
jgi:hypothetical protein